MQNGGRRNVKTLDEIVAAAERLKPAELLQLRRRLDQLEKKLWKQELSAATKQLKSLKISDREIDRIVMRRRRESRR